MLRYILLIAAVLIISISGLFIFSPISPVSWKAPDVTQSAYSCNLDEPEYSLTAASFVNDLPATTDGLAVTDDGRLFAAMKNGKIAEVNTLTGQWKIVAELNDGRFLGISAARDGSYILGVDQKSNSLFYFDLTSGAFPVKGELLVSHFKGKKLLWLNDVVHTDRHIYITVTSRVRHNSKFRHEILEHRPNGFILRYDRQTKQLEEVFSDLITTNGLVIKGDNKLLVAETSAYRVREISLDTLKTSGFTENLPGLPGNLTKSDRGDVSWLTLVAARVARLDRLSESPIIRRLLPWLPESLQPQPTVHPCIMELNGDKTRAIVIKGAERMPTFGTALEHKGFLYLSPYSSPTKPNEIDGRLFRIKLSQTHN